MVDIFYLVLIVGAILLGRKLWVFLSREDAKHRVQVERGLATGRLRRAKQELDELYRHFRTEMVADPELTPFLGLLDAAHHGTVEELKLAYAAAPSELPLVVAYKLQQIHGAQLELLAMVEGQQA